MLATVHDGTWSVLLKKIGLLRHPRWWHITNTPPPNPTLFHWNGVIMGAMASQIISLTIVYSTVYSDGDKKKHQNSASLAFMRGIHRRPVNSRHKWPVTRKMIPFDDVIMSVSWKSLVRVFWHLTNLSDTFSNDQERHFTYAVYMLPKGDCSDQCRQKKNHRRSLNWRKLYLRSNILRKWYIGMPLGGISAECTKFGGTKTRNKATI